MENDNSSINNYNHSISLLERKTLVITGVKKIDTFDKIHFILDTTMGIMVIKGEDLELIKLDTLSGNVTIVVTFTKEKMHRRFARYALIRLHTLKEKQKITKIYDKDWEWKRSQSFFMIFNWYG